MTGYPQIAETETDWDSLLNARDTPAGFKLLLSARVVNRLRVLWTVCENPRNTSNAKRMNRNSTWLHFLAYCLKIRSWAADRSKQHFFGAFAIRRGCKQKMTVTSNATGWPGLHKGWNTSYSLELLSSTNLFSSECRLGYAQHHLSSTLVASVEQVHSGCISGTCYYHHIHCW